MRKAEIKVLPGSCASPGSIAQTIVAGSAALKPKDRPLEKPPVGLASARECGDCRVCCTLFAIPEVKKDLNELCRHARSGPGVPGCKIYSHRPEVCQKFECAWKQGLASDCDRPDVLGVMFYTLNLEDGLPGLAIVESTPGAFDEPRVRELISIYQARKPGRIILRAAEDQRFRQATVLIEGKPLQPAGT